MATDPTRESPPDSFNDLPNPDLQNARIAVAQISAKALGDTSRFLRAVAQVEKDRVVLGLSVIAGMASQTGLGALTLYSQGMWYAGAALTRQLVEHHHLCEYFAQDLTRVTQWLDADERQLQRIFSPKALRDAGGFTRTDYAAHCTWGGHPNPQGAWLIIDSVTGPRCELLLVDIAQHMQFIYIAMVNCLGEEGSGKIPGMLKAFNYIEKWRHVDPYANRLTPSQAAQAVP